MKTGGTDGFNCGKSEYGDSSQRQTTVNTPAQASLFKHFFEFFHVHLIFAHGAGVSPLGSRERVPYVFI